MNDTGFPMIVEKEIERLNWSKSQANNSDSHSMNNILSPRQCFSVIEDAKEEEEDEIYELARSQLSNLPFNQ